jgi:hypothetical protein
MAPCPPNAAIEGFGLRRAVTVRGRGDRRTRDGPLENSHNRALAAEMAAGHRAAWRSRPARYAGRDERIEICSRDEPRRPARRPHHGTAEFACLATQST